MTNIKTLVALLVAGAAMTFTACSSSEESIIEQPVNPTEPKVYTMTVQASKGGASREQNGTRSSSAEAQPALGEAKGGDEATTRALSLDGKTLNATWDGTEKVKVYKRNGSTSTLIGTLSASVSSSDKTTLSGTVSPAPDPTAGDYLDFYYIDPTMDYTGQDGTLATIAQKHDFCDVASLAPEGSDRYIVDGNKITIDELQTLQFGAPYYGTCGNIIIKGGYIKATSESGSAGIGCGYFGNCGDITITGGTVEAYGHDSAGIGCSDYGDNTHCGKITIANTVTKVVSTTTDNDGGVIGQTMGSCPSVKFGDCEETYSVVAERLAAVKQVDNNIGIEK